MPQDTDITAVVAANDVLAMGAVRASLCRGWGVPDDLSVFGWDDEELARLATPSLSTVAIDRERQGREAMGRLIAIMRGIDPPPIDTHVPAHGDSSRVHRSGPGGGQLTAFSTSALIAFSSASLRSATA